MKPIIRSAVLPSLVLLSTLIQAPRAQGYLLPDTLWARVLFYADHTSDQLDKLAMSISLLECCS